MVKQFETRYLNYLTGWALAQEIFSVKQKLNAILFKEFKSMKLAEISKQCHQLKLAGKDEEIKKLETENYELIKELFRVKNGT